MESKYILLISNKSDITTDLVVKRLHQRNILFKRFNTEDFPQEFCCQISINNNEQNVSLFFNDIELLKNNVKSVWYRRPKFSQFKNISFSEDEFNFAIRESNAFLLNLWAFLKNKKWINNPFDLYRAERKAYQLQMASKCRFNIPDTIITNKYDVANNFIEKNNRKVVSKPISHGGLGEDDSFAIFTTDLEVTDYIINQESIQISPLILQKKIEKLFDIRISIFGDRIFAHKISIKNEIYDIDWRVYKPNDISYELIDVPTEIKVKIKKYMSALNLYYGAMDFIVDKNGNWYFIEINPNGQFAWLEIAAGDKLIDSLIDLLVE